MLLLLLYCFIVRMSVYRRRGRGRCMYRVETKRRSCKTNMKIIEFYYFVVVVSLAWWRTSPRTKRRQRRRRHHYQLYTTATLL